MTELLQDSEPDLDLADFLVIAEVVTGTDAALLAGIPHVVARAESALAAPFATFAGVEFYEGLAVKAACSALGWCATTRCPTATSASPTSA